MLCVGDNFVTVVSRDPENLAVTPDLALGYDFRRLTAFVENEVPDAQSPHCRPAVRRSDRRIQREGLSVARRHGEDQERDVALDDLLDDPRDGVVVLGVLVLRALDIVRILGVRRRELDEGHEFGARLDGLLLALEQCDLLLERLEVVVLLARFSLPGFPFVAPAGLRIDAACHQNRFTGRCRG